MRSMKKYLTDIENPFHNTIDLESQIENVITNEDVLFLWALVTATLENDLVDIQYQTKSSRFVPMQRLRNDS